MAILSVIKLMREWLRRGQAIKNAESSRRTLKMTSDSRTARLKNWFEILMTSLVSKSTNLTNLLFSKFGPAVSFYLDQYLHFYIGYKLHLKLLM